MTDNAHAVPHQVRTIYTVRSVSFVWCLLVVGLSCSGILADVLLTSYH